MNYFENQYQQFNYECEIKLDRNNHEYSTYFKNIELK